MKNGWRGYGMGWIPDYPDFRDYTENTSEVKVILQGNAAGTGGGRTLHRGDRIKKPSAVDLRDWCSPIEDQGKLGSCTAQAGAGVIEYYERKSFGRHIDASRLFLYKTTRNLMKMKGDTGAFLRTTIGAMVLFGVPPEEYWAYTDDPDKIDAEPPAFCYAFAQNYKTLKYYRHDPPGSAHGQVLERIKAYLAAGHPSMFGFTVYSSMEQAAKDGRIPFPSQKERIEGGHAVVAVGFDDAMIIENKTGARTTAASVAGRGAATKTAGRPNPGSAARIKTKGALLIRNSWGADWGEKGYGWLPYDYVLTGLAEDFWSVIKKEWVDTGVFDE